MTTCKSFTKSCAVFLAAMLMLLAAFPLFASTTASAADEIVWTPVSEEAITVTDGVIVCTGEVSGNISLPDGITAIGANAFKGCENITGVKIPEGVTVINECAFYDCTSLETLILPESLQTIGGLIAAHSKITEITIPEHVTLIFDDAFAYCPELRRANFNATNCTIQRNNSNHGIFLNCDSFTEIVFGEEVTEIPKHVCSNAVNLQTVTFEGRITSIHSKAFYNCNAINNVNCNAFTPEELAQADFLKDNPYLADAQISCEAEEETANETTTSIKFASPSADDETSVAVEPQTTEPETTQTTTQPATAVTEPATTEITTREVTESTTQSTTESTTQIATENTESDTEAVTEPSTLHNEGTVVDNGEQAPEKLGFLEKIIRFFKRIFSTIIAFFKS